MASHDLGGFPILHRHPIRRASLRPVPAVVIAVVGQNMLANAAGIGLRIAVLLAVVPLYLRLLGAEAYGLVGLLTTVTIASSMLDFGLAATMTRETARMTAQPTPDGSFADVAATLKAACWAAGIAAGVVFTAMASTLTARWLNFSTVSADEVHHALVLIGVALPALVVRGFYVAALNGLQRQGLANVVQVSGVTARGIMTIAVLHAVAPTATMFFLTHAILFYFEVVALAAALRASLPVAARRGRVRPASLRPVLAFSTGMAVTTLLGLALTSMDHVILSAVLPLAEFGYYTLAVTVATLLGEVVRPVTIAVYPRFTQLFARGDVREISEEYHFFSQLVAIVMLPIGALLVFFPAEVLALWTRDDELVRWAAVVLSLRALGTMLNTLLHVPHVVQLAFGWSSLGAGVNAIALLVTAPLVVTLTALGGGLGAALAWTLANLGILLVFMARMHRRVLRGELTRWYAHLLAPAFAVTTVAALGSLLMPEALGAAGRAGWLGGTGVLAVGAAVSAASAIRQRLATAVRPA